MWRRSFTDTAGCHPPAARRRSPSTVYDDARSRAQLIAEVTTRGYMPPWLPSPGPPFFEGERRLALAEVAVLAEWAAAGSPSGDLAAAPRAARGEPAHGWPLVGSPTWWSKWPTRSDFRPGATTSFGPRLPVDLGGARRRWVRAVEITPGSARVVHHGTLMADPTDSSRRLDAAHPTPGFDGMRTVLAGARSRRPPGGGGRRAWRPRRGETTWRGSSPPAPTSCSSSTWCRRGARRRCALAPVSTSPQAPPARRPLAVRPLGLKTIDILAGDAAYGEQDRFVLPAAVDVLAVYPHAHYRCRSMRATATLARRTGRDAARHSALGTSIGRISTATAYRSGYRLAPRSPWNTSSTTRPPIHATRTSRRGASSMDQPRATRWGICGCRWLRSRKRTPLRLTRGVERRESESNIAGWRAALARTPDDATLHFNLGSELVLIGELDAGIAELERSVELDAALGRARNNLGNAFIARAQRSGGESGRQDLERAVACFERAAAVADAAEAPDALFNLANTQAALGRFEEAHRSYDRALELRPAFVEARLNKATTYARQDRRADAIAEVERCLDADPTYLAALWNLALLRGQEPAGMSAALDRVDRALAIEPGSPPLRMLRGDLLLHLERFADATAAYRAVIDVEPRSADAWANLGRSLAREGRSEEAEQAVKRALEIDAKNGAALEVRRELER